MEKDGENVNKLKKVNILILSIFIIANIFSFYKTISSAANTTGSGLAINVSDYKPSDFTEDADTVSFANKIIGFFQALGSIVSVLALVLIGIKYMTGSIEEKAEYKQTMIYYLVGAILVFAISNISAMIYNFARTLNN